MLPPERKKLVYEKVQTDEWVNGTIKEVQYDEEHKTNFKDDETGEDKIISAVRFKLELDGCKFPHYTRWGTFSLHEKSNLFRKYIVFLVKNAKPDMRFDLDVLNGLPVKTMWSENGDFQNLEMIRPLKGQVEVTPTVPDKPDENAPEAEEIQF